MSTELTNQLPPSSNVRELAVNIADALFSGAGGTEKATHLCMFSGGHTGRYLAGWCEDAVVTQVEKLLSPAAEPVTTLTVEDWRQEVHNGDTVLGFAEWIEHRQEMEADELLDRRQLIATLARVCRYAQMHINDTEAWSAAPTDRTYMLQCTSFVVACFLSRRVGDGVDWDVVVEPLVELPAKSFAEWEGVVSELLTKLEEDGD